jgi:hypothetical protein
MDLAGQKRHSFSRQLVRSHRALIEALADKLFMQGSLGVGFLKLAGCPLGIRFEGLLSALNRRIDLV